MVVSLDCTKLELLEEGNSNFPMKKSKEKIGAASRRKKGKTRNMKRLNPIPASSGEDAQLDKAIKVLLSLFCPPVFSMFCCVQITS